MATFPRGHNARDIHRRNKRIVIGTVATTIQGKVTWLLDPADHLTLRGIPAIGRNVQGAIAGTRPETAVMSSDAAGTLPPGTSPSEA